MNGDWQAHEEMEKIFESILSQSQQLRQLSIIHLHKQGMKLFRSMYQVEYETFDYDDENSDEEYEYKEPKIISEKGLFNLQELELSKWKDTVRGEEDCGYAESFPGSYFYNLRYLLSK